MLTDFVLKFKFFNIVILVLWLSSIILLFWVHLYFPEKLEKWWLSDLFCFARSLFSLLLHNFYCNVLSWLPVNLVSISFLDLSIFNVKVFGQFFVREPFVFREVKSNWKLWKILAFFSLDSLQMLENGLINFLDLLSNHVRVNEGFEPIFRDGSFGRIEVLRSQLFTG